MEEPVCEPQAVALYYVSRLAKNYVKVLISGEGGDEAFAGYQTYRGVLWLERLKSVLGPARWCLFAGLSRYLNRAIDAATLQKYGPLLSHPFDDYYYGRTYSPATYFNSQFRQLYSDDFAGFVDKSLGIAGKKPSSSAIADSVLNRMLYVDTKTSLPDDLAPEGGQDDDGEFDRASSAAPRSQDSGICCVLAGKLEGEGLNYQIYCESGPA